MTRRAGKPRKARTPTTSRLDRRSISAIDLTSLGDPASPLGWLTILARKQIELALLVPYPMLTTRRLRTISEEALRLARETD
jgi:hypothetical protein